jgi:hypothetical protein
MLTTIQKQTKILKIFKSFSDKLLERITDDNFSFKILSKNKTKLFKDCIYITLGKEEATNKELIKGINEVMVLAVLELFRRNGLVFINKKGNFEHTTLGKEVVKKLKEENK